MSRTYGLATLLLVVLAVPVGAAPQRLPAPLPAPGAVPGTAPMDAAPSSWETLSPALQRQRRADHATWRAMSEAERQRVRAAASRFAALPPARQQALRTQFQAQDQAFRDGWRLGPLLGEHYGRLQGLFGFLPETQRATALAVLQALTPAQVAKLTLVSQRTPPQERDQVRAAFLAVPAAGRDAWLSRAAGE